MNAAEQEHRKWGREEIVAAAFAAAGLGASLDPIRVQKLLFLIDRVVSEQIGGPFFHFQPYHYGPFDRAVYSVISGMSATGHIRIDESGDYNRYFLTKSGVQLGTSTLATLSAPVADYFRRAAQWIRVIPYRSMLAAIYREYPEMATKSVVGHLGMERKTTRENAFIRGITQAFDLTGMMYRTPDAEIGLQSEADALHGDWRAVGEDIEQAMVQLGKSACIW